MLHTSLCRYNVRQGCSRNSALEFAAKNEYTDLVNKYLNADASIESLGPPDRGSIVAMQKCVAHILIHLAWPLISGAVFWFGLQL